MNNQSIPFPIDKDSYEVHALFQTYVLYVGTKLHAY